MIVQKIKKVVNGAVREIEIFSWPKVQYSFSDGSKVVREWNPEVKMDWLTGHGYSERRAYMIAYNASEADMQRIEND
jgi:hypothetical protein